VQKTGVCVLQEGKQNTPEMPVGRNTPNNEQKRYPDLKQKLRTPRNREEYVARHLP
jgi:hypothetical protein